jgi:uncharacterized protein (TIGR00255 family)
MTGYGRASSRRGALSAEAEARSVNGRFLQVRCRVPSELLRLEARLEALVRKSAERGTVDVLVRLRADRAASLPRVNHKVLGVYRKALVEAGGGDAGLLLSLPGVIRLDEEQVSETAMESLVLAVAGAAVEQMRRSRLAEGSRLKRSLLRELSALRRHGAALRRLAPEAVRQFQANLRRRLDGLLAGAGVPADDPSLLREVALLASRTDVTEELDRLESHIDALAAALDAKEPVGRSLDFVLQEIGREVNTVGSKCADARAAARVVGMKTCVERLREQAANIE